MSDQKIITKKENGQVCPCARCKFRNKKIDSQPCLKCSTSFDGWTEFKQDDFHIPAYELNIEIPD